MKSCSDLLKVDVAISSAIALTVRPVGPESEGQANSSFRLRNGHVVEIGEEPRTGIALEVKPDPSFPFIHVVDLDWALLG